jgi:hypothetical protein
MELFDQFDRVIYNGHNLTNILRRIKPIKGILEKIGVYYEYTIKEGERADMIAHDYYGDSSFTWLVYACNGIYDPYYQWPLSHPQMIKYLTRKYGDYYQTQIDIKWYRNPAKSYSVSQETLESWDPIDRIGWEPETIFQYEDRLNDEKRKIRLISNKYLLQITNEVKELF